MYTHYPGGLQRWRPVQALLRERVQRWLAWVDAYPLHALALLAILAIAASLFLNRDRLPPVPQAGENDTWWAIALNLAHGEGYSLCLPRYFPFCGPSNQATAAREPLPVLLFAGIAVLSGESLWAAVAAELFVFLAILVAIYYLTAAWTNRRTGLLAAFFWSLYIPAHELVPQVSGDLLAALLVALGLIFTMRARQNRHTRDWFLAGTCLGLAAVTRSGTLVVAAAVAGGLLLEGWRSRLHPRETLRPVILVLGLVVLLMSPWLVRNRLVLGRAVVGSSLIGYNLYRHNYMIATGDYFRHVGGKEALTATQALVSRRTDLLGVENEAEMDSVYRHEAIAVIRAHLREYVLLSAYRFLPLWFNWGYAEAYGRKPATTDYAIMGIQAGLLLLAFAGLRPVKLTWPLWSSVLAVCAVYMAVDSRLLYTMPVMPLVMSLSARGASELFRRIFPASFPEQPPLTPMALAGPVPGALGSGDLSNL